MFDPPPADFLVPDLNRHFLEPLMTGLFVADVFAFVVMLLVAVACCREAIRERRQHALAMEALRREAAVSEADHKGP